MLALWDVEQPGAGQSFITAMRNHFGAALGGTPPPVRRLGSFGV
jgi:hypothetical protein